VRKCIRSGCDNEIPASCRITQVYCSRSCKSKHWFEMAPQEVKKAYNRASCERKRLRRATDPSYLAAHNARSWSWKLRNPSYVRKEKREWMRKKYRSDPDFRAKHKATSRACRRRLRRWVSDLNFLWELEMATQVLENKAAWGSDADQDLDLLMADLSERPTEELKAMLVEGMRLTRNHLHRLATIVVILEGRGEKLDDCGIPRPILSLLRDIGKGTLIVDVVLTFGARSLYVNHAKKKSPDEQRRLCAMNRTELDKEVQRRERSPRHLANATTKYGLHAGPGVMPPLETITAKASVKDAADMCMDIVRANEESPVQVATLLLGMLNDFLAREAPAQKPSQVPINKMLDGGLSRNGRRNGRAKVKS
jgi:hypothetical protein